MNEDKIKKFYMNYVSKNHLSGPVLAEVNEEERRAVFTYEIDLGTDYQRIYCKWTYTVYLS